MDFKTISKGNFFGMLLHSFTYYQLSEFNLTGVGSDAIKNNIHSFNEDFLKHVNILIESTQGIEGFYDISVPKTEYIKSPLEFSQGLFEFIEVNKKIFEYDFQKSLINDIQIGLGLLIYKLKFLK